MLGLVELADAGARFMVVGGHSARHHQSNAAQQVDAHRRRNVVADI